MNYKQIPFDINIAKDIVSGKVIGKIRTRDGHDVRIYDFNVNNNIYIIAGKIIDIEEDVVETWCDDGCVSINDFNSDLNLVLLVEEGKVFKPYDKVIVRMNNAIWVCSLFSHYNRNESECTLIDGVSYVIDDILPFEGNEHLVGTGTIDE